MLPLERFNAVWRPNEPERLTPVYVERVTIREALKGDLLSSLFGTVQLIEPTFGVRQLPLYLLGCVRDVLPGLADERIPSLRLFRPEALPYARDPAKEGRMHANLSKTRMTSGQHCSYESCSQGG